MVVLAIATAFFQEHRSNEAAARLRAMVQTTASVRRAVRRRPAICYVEIPIEQLVPGDIVRLSAGDMIPADLRCSTAKDLFINQSALTGEAMPRGEVCPRLRRGRRRSVRPAEPLLHGRECRQRGTAYGVVVRTGAQTFFGQLAARDRRAARSDRLRPGDQPVHLADDPLHRRDGADRVPDQRPDQAHWLEALLFAVAVAVGLTPEMLPMIVTVNLAKGAIAMSREKVIVKRLNAIQNFGAMDVLCTDKTGTLTQDRIILKRHLDIRGEESERVLQYAYLNSHFQSGLQEPARRRRPGACRACTRCSKVDEQLPQDRRDSVRLRAAPHVGRVSSATDKHILICKGAVEEIFAVCTRYDIDGDDRRSSTTSHFATAKEKTVALNADGFRVVAVAYKEMRPPQSGLFRRGRGRA